MAKLILHSKPSTPIKPNLVFEFSINAAMENVRSIMNHGSLDNFVKNNPRTTVAYGSEFRPTNILDSLFRRHVNWPRLRTILEEGSRFPLSKLDEETAQKDLKAALHYGNHKSAQIHCNILKQHLEKELKKGWIIPILPEHIPAFQNAALAPLGIVSQSTINDRGEIVASNRVTHDLSFPGKESGTSVNSRTKMEELVPCKYGHMLLRTIHYITALRLKYPNLPILLQKIDYKSAYRRQQLNAETALQCLSCIEIDGQLYIMINLRLSFGGSACPAEWCLISESITDLANRILNDETWEPEDMQPIILDKVPPTKILDDSIPFKKAKELIVDIPTEPVGQADVYIDDVCTIGVLSSDTTEKKLRSGVLLAMELTGRPLATDEPLPRDPMPSMDKLLSEAGLEEEKCLLGWILNTRSLIISLHTEKHTQWTCSIQDILNASGRTNKKVLEVTLGRLNHAATVLPLARHFLSRLSFATHSAEYFKPVKLNKSTIKDLELWIQLLTKLRNGISMNLLTIRPPNIVMWTDACEHGLGGISYPRGRAWRFHISSDLRHRAHINLLEFLAILVGIWLDLTEQATGPEDCILAFGDNTSAISWIHKSKFRTDNEPEPLFQAKLTVARKIASLSIDNDLRLYSKWLPGESNKVADYLSRNSTSTNDELTHYIINNYPTQVPKNLETSALPKEIESFISNLLQSLPKPQQPQQGTNALEMQHGTNGLPSWNPSDCEMTNSWNPSIQDDTETKSYHYLFKTFAWDQILEKPQELRDWWQDQSRTPSAHWLRPSWKTVFQIPD